MYDSLRYNLQLADGAQSFSIPCGCSRRVRFGDSAPRAENTDDPQRLRAIFRTFHRIARDGLPIVIPLHPRTRKKLEELHLSFQKLQVLGRSHIWICLCYAELPDDFD